MKILTLSFLIFHSISLAAQDKVVGRHRDYFGNHIQINADSTFKYTFNSDGANSWTKGVWNLKNDTVYFHMIPTYDTVSKINENNLSVDILILSQNEITERMELLQSAFMAIASGGQNRIAYPDKLIVKKDRLYKIQNGRLVRKQKWFWAKKKLSAWYFKSDD